MAHASKRKRKPVCPKCGSDNVQANAGVAWDIDTQSFDIANIFDSGHACNDCGANDITFKWVKLSKSATDRCES